MRSSLDRRITRLEVASGARGGDWMADFDLLPDDILTILDDINQRRAAGAAIDDDEALGCQNMAALYAAGLDTPEGLIETLRKQGRLNDGQ